MEYRSLGRSGIRVSAVAMGCDYVLKDWGEGDRRAAREAIDAALDLGMNLFDTAELYGKGVSEEVLGEALDGRRARAVIATKVAARNLAPAGVRAACEGSLRRLRTDTIDLYQIHWPNPAIPLADTWGALEELKRQGKIRAIGLSNFSEADLAAVRPLGRAETNQVPWSLLFRAVEFGLRDACMRDGVGLLCYSPMFQGLLSGKYASADEVPPHKANTRHFSGTRPGVRHGGPGCEREMFEAIRRVRAIAEGLGRPTGEVALAWVLAGPGVSSVLAGARTADQVRRNAAGADLALPPDVRSALSEATEPVKSFLGSGLHMWAEARPPATPAPPPSRP